MMRSLRRGASAAAVIVCGVAGLAGCDTGPEPPTDPPFGPIGTKPVGAPGVQLVAYDSCASALRELREAAVKQVGPYGLNGPDVIYDRAGAPMAAESASAKQSAEPVTPEHSTTNTHEAAADEPDLVKTDGKRLVSVLDDGKLRVVDVASREVTGTVELKGAYPTGLFLDGDRALVLAPGGQPIGPAEGRIAPHAESVRIVQVDLTGDGSITGDMTVEGGYVDARATDGVARVVIRSGPRLEWTHPAGRHSDAAATERNKQVIRRSSIDDWLPRYELRAAGSETSGRLVDCARVSHPKPSTGTSLLTVLTLDVDGKLDRGDPVSVTGSGATVYGTGENLYVADDDTGRFGPMPTADIAPRRPDKQRTKVYQFDVSGSGAPQFVASGAVDGALLNQYSLSEHDGHLRVATTTTDWATPRQSGPPDSESAVAVLRREGERLEEVGSIGGLGKG
ncbi:MAG: beta-propeller domain-containing protein, partial [Thermocrispum sp.]